MHSLLSALTGSFLTLNPGGYSLQQYPRSLKRMAGTGVYCTAQRRLKSVLHGE